MASSHFTALLLFYLYNYCPENIFILTSDFHWEKIFYLTKDFCLPWKIFIVHPSAELGEWAEITRLFVNISPSLPVSFSVLWCLHSTLTIIGLAWKGVGVLTWLLVIPSFQVFFVISLLPAHNKDKNRERKWIIVIWEIRAALVVVLTSGRPSLSFSHLSFSIAVVIVLFVIWKYFLRENTLFSLKSRKQIDLCEVLWNKSVEVSLQIVSDWLGSWWIWIVWMWGGGGSVGHTRQSLFIWIFRSVGSCLSSQSLHWYCPNSHSKHI